MAGHPPFDVEIVTPDVDAVCATYEKTHGLRFGETVAELGGARTADLDGVGRIGVRALVASA